MTAEERKREQELRILHMVYDSSIQWEHRERPDFSVRIDKNPKPIGVEITQIFPSESHARLHLMRGYMPSLWRGERHRHRADVGVLKTGFASIHSREGELKQENVPFVITASPTEDQRRAALESAIRTKSSRGYPAHEFSHMNLIVLDWFGLPFNADEYSSATFVSLEMKELLIESPFREIFVLLRDTSVPPKDQQLMQPDYVMIRLTQLFLAAEYFLTRCAILQTEYATTVKNADHLARLIGSHLTGSRGIGQLVTLNARSFVHFKATAVGLSDSGGMEFLDFDDQPLGFASADAVDMLPDDVAALVNAYVGANSFMWGYSEKCKIDPPPTADESITVLAVEEHQKNDRK